MHPVLASLGEAVLATPGRGRDIADPVEAPFAGIVRDVRPGVGITIRAAGRGIRGIVALGGPTRGRLQTGTDGELRSGGLDVGAAGTIFAKSSSRVRPEGNSLGSRSVAMMTNV